MDQLNKQTEHEQTEHQLEPPIWKTVVMAAIFGFLIFGGSLIVNEDKARPVSFSLFLIKSAVSTMIALTVSILVALVAERFGKSPRSAFVPAFVVMILFILITGWIAGSNYR